TQSNLLVPCVDGGEPVIGRLVGGAAQKSDDEDEMVGLRGREIGLDPELVSGLEIGHLRDGQGDRAARDTHIDLGSCEVEAGVVSGVKACGERECQQACEYVIA